MLGLAGSLLVAVGGLGAGALLRPAPGSWFGIAALPRALGVAMVATGVVALAAAWWAARAHLDRVAPHALTRAASLWALPLVVAPPLFTRDLYAYAAQAATAARGLDPYELGPDAGGGDYSAHVDAVWRGTASPYGPAFLGPASLLVRLADGRVELAVVLLRLLAVVGLLLAAWALPRLSTNPQRALWLGLANPLVLLHGVAGGHNDVLMVGLVLAALAAPAVAAGALVVLGALVKAPALAALPALALAPPTWRARLRTGVLVAVGAVVAAAVVPVVTGLGWGWLSTLDAGRSLLSLFSPVTGLATLLQPVVPRATVLDVMSVVGVLAGGAVLLLAPRLGAVRALGLAMLVVVLLSPTVLPWYLLWAVLPLAAVADRRQAAALGAACLVLCLLTWPDGRSVVRPPLYGVPMVLAGAAAAVAYRREPRETARS